MLRIGSMNLMLHGLENPNIASRDALSDKFTVREAYTLVLAAPVTGADRVC
jgi:type I restriction enzyme M protein